MARLNFNQLFAVNHSPTILGSGETAFVLDPFGFACTFLHPDSGEACRLRTFGFQTYPLQKEDADSFIIARVGRFTTRTPYFSSGYIRRTGRFYLFVFTDASCAVSYFPEMGSYVSTVFEARQAARALGLEFLLTPP